ncbi:MAG TPA: hypothetical protein PLK65_05160, partial [Candidatus Cloacimonas sp.]|nr:hypothetical protein [Candidatus Cloacimonas sp.]
MKSRFLLILLMSLSLLSALNSTPTGEIIPISVSLTGYVENPGVYQMTPVNRLSDLLLLNKTATLEKVEKTQILQEKIVEVPKPAELLSPPNPEKEKENIITLENNQGLRSIQITRSGKIETYDLMKFYRLGDSSQNPFLKDGDVVFVPAIKYFISISGGINLPGELEFVEGDKLGTIIDLSLGFTFDADISKVQLYRYKENRIDYDVLNYDL